MPQRLTIEDLIQYLQSLPKDTEVLVADVLDSEGSFVEANLTQHFHYAKNANGAGGALSIGRIENL